eukprot:scaffold673783_cov59-Prasinocladus_malaysianus.AAC.1
MQSRKSLYSHVYITKKFKGRKYVEEQSNRQHNRHTQSVCNPCGIWTAPSSEAPLSAAGLMRVLAGAALAFVCWGLEPFWLLRGGVERLPVLAFA